MPKVSIPESLSNRLFNQPSDQLSDGLLAELRKTSKALIERAIEKKLEPVFNNDEFDVAVFFNLTFKPAYDKTIREYKKANPTLTEGKIITGFLLIAEKKELYHEFIESGASSVAFQPYLTACNRAERPAQTTFFNYLETSVSQSNISMIEAATGVGKTLAMIASANNAAIKNKCRVVIATPTIALIKQFITEYQAINAYEHLAPIRIVIGMSSFVSIHSLLRLLEDETYQHLASIVQEWIDNGGKALESENNFTSNYLLESLLDAVPQLPASEVVLRHSDDEDDAGMNAYRDQFVTTTGTDEEIILTTHAMIAVDMRKRLLQENTIEGVADLKSSFDERIKQAMLDDGDVDIHKIFIERDMQLGTFTKDEDIGHLPLFHFAYIDEAHLFEENISNTLSNNLSLNSVVNQIRKLARNNCVPQSRLRDIEASFKQIIDSSVGLDNKNIGDFREINSHLTLAVKKFFSAISGIRVKSNAQNKILSYLKADAAMVTKSLSIQGPKGPECILKFSPVKRFPQLIIGQRNNKALLSRFWSRLSAGMCVSASLYSKKKAEDAAVYYFKILSIPKNRYQEFTPIIPYWVQKPVKQFLVPEVVNSNWLMPVSRRDKLSPEDKKLREVAWYSEVAEMLMRVQSSAAGGTLSLMTSYEAVNQVVQCMRENDSQINLVYPDGELTINQQKALFISSSQRGEKPIWLCVGAAWTGLDINGKDVGITSAADDDILTDLVVPKIPFGLNKTISHEIRRRDPYYGSTYEIQETSMRFKQGIGRLVRREGLKANRRIWLLDQRLLHPRYKGFTFPISQLVNTYNVETFKKSLLLN